MRAAPLDPAFHALAAALTLTLAAGCHRTPSNKAAQSRRPVAPYLDTSSQPGSPTTASPSGGQSAAPSPDVTPTALPAFEVDAVSTKRGAATWYDVPANSLAQRRAWPDEMTAASDTLHRNTYARVTRLDNGKSVIVRITDNGIHNKGDIIDLDRPAAEALGMIKAGKVQVKVEALALKNADTSGPPTHQASGQNLPSKEPGASAADEKAASDHKVNGTATP